MNKDAIIIAGNGPSLGYIDYECIPKEFSTFRMNNFFFEKEYFLGRKVSYYYTDQGYLKNQYFNLKCLKNNGEYEIGTFFSNGDLSKYPAVHDITPLSNGRIEFKEFISYYYNYYGWLISGGIGAVFASISLGYKNIYIAGIDFYKNTKSIYSHNLGKNFCKQNSRDDSEEKIISVVNHYHPAEMQIEALLLAKKILEDNGGHMYSIASHSPVNEFLPFAPKSGVQVLRKEEKERNAMLDWAELPEIKEYTPPNVEQLEEKTIKDVLQIVIVTYNRKKYLERTFSQIFSNESPIRNLKITILDNSSNDGTFEFVNEYKKNFPNIDHIVHTRNIGGNANICRAFELATYPYVWVLCDDDEYDWSHWDEVENAIKEEKDLIVVANYCKPEESDVNLIKQLTFVPAGIYKTEHFSAGMMINAYYNISTMFPQIGIASYYINNKLDIYICKNWAVRMCVNEEDASYTRGVERTKPHPYMKNNYWQFGFATAMQLFEDSNLRERLAENINLEPVRGIEGYLHMLGITKNLCNNNYRNLTELFCALNDRQRREFIESVVHFYSPEVVAQKLAVYIKGNSSIKNTVMLSVYISEEKKYSAWFDFRKNKIFWEISLLKILTLRIWDRAWVHLRRNAKGIDIVLGNRAKLRIWSPKWFHLRKTHKGTDIIIFEKFKTRIWPGKK